MKLPNEKKDIERETLFENVSGASTKFVYHWLKEKLITGVSHNTTKEVTDDMFAFEAWVEDFRVVGKTNMHAQIYFQVHSVVPWKILIDDGKDAFKKEDLSILLKRNKAKG